MCGVQYVNKRRVKVTADTSDGIALNQSKIILFLWSQNLPNQAAMSRKGIIAL